jgi:3-mercaptopyruvate sulfurtransferase SseA
MPARDKQAPNLYWTGRRGRPSIASMLIERLSVLALAALPWFAQAEPLSAVQARDALAQGASAWDVRSQAPHLLPGAARADLGRWAQGGGPAAIEAAVSAAGIDLSRDVVIYGVAGDPLAQALHRALQPLAGGRVYWLVGGIDEWQAAGLPTATAAAVRPPVPQRLVARGATLRSAAPAAAALRQSATAAPAVTARL